MDTNIRKYAGWEIRPHPTMPYLRDPWGNKAWLIVPPKNYPIKFKTEDFEKYGGRIVWDGIEGAKRDIKTYNNLLKDKNIEYVTSNRKVS